jgi:hypothetical protein
MLDDVNVFRREKARRRHMVGEWCSSSPLMVRRTFSGAEIRRRPQLSPHVSRTSPDRDGALHG